MTSHQETFSYINAGGRGTRLASLFGGTSEKGVAKALLEVGEPPLKLIDHHIANSREQGFRHTIVAAGDQRGVYDYIKEMYGDDSDVTALYVDYQRGTGGDLIVASHQVEALSQSDVNIVVQNVDTVLDIDLNAVDEKQRAVYRRYGNVATIALSRNEGLPNAGAYLLDSDDHVLASHEFDDPIEKDVEQMTFRRATSAGVVAIRSDFLRSLPVVSEQVSLYRDVLRSALRQNALHAFDNGHRFFKDVGTVADWQTSQDDPDFKNLLKYNEKK